MNANQAIEVDEEKKGIQDPCKEYFMKEYRLENVYSIGLFIGARETILKFIELFPEKFKLKKQLISDIVL